MSLHFVAIVFPISFFFLESFLIQKIWTFDTLVVYGDFSIVNVLYRKSSYFYKMLKGEGALWLTPPYKGGREHYGWPPFLKGEGSIMVDPPSLKGRGALLFDPPPLVLIMVDASKNFIIGFNCMFELFKSLIHAVLNIAKLRVIYAILRSL